MRFWGHRETPAIRTIPDIGLNVLLTAATGQAFDYPTGCDAFRISVSSTIANFNGPVIFNPSSTGAAVPTTGGTISTAGSSTVNIGVNVTLPFEYLRPRGSTGFSLICASSMSVTMEFWSRAGTTG